MTMKILTTIGCVAILAAMTLSASAAEQLKHVVAFKFKSTATPDEIKKVETAFAALKKKISQVKSLEWGTNVSPENKNDGCTHCWILTFKSAKDRDAYLVHPDHKEFGKLVGPVIDKVFVIDFVVQK
jgi:hypothetical protein